MANEPVQDSDPTIGRLVSDATRDVSSLIRNEIQLAKAEIQFSVKSGGTGIALFAVAAFIAVLAVIGNLQYFISPLVVTKGGPGFSTTVPALLMYQSAVSFGEYGYAMAIAVMLFVVVALLTVLSRSFSRASGQGARSLP